jgi:hypothetical protein
MSDPLTRAHVGHPSRQPRHTFAHTVAGQAFVDPGQGNVHIASNASGTDQAKAVATFFGVPAGSPATIMAPPAIRPAQDASSSKVSGPSGSSTSSEVTRQAPSCSSSSTVTRPGT